MAPESPSATWRTNGAATEEGIAGTSTGANVVATYAARRYGRSGAKAKFATYLNIGHGTDQRINEDVTAFFREAIAK